MLKTRRIVKDEKDISNLFWKIVEQHEKEGIIDCNKTKYMWKEREESTKLALERSKMDHFWDPLNILSNGRTDAEMDKRITMVKKQWECLILFCGAVIF